MKKLKVALVTMFALSCSLFLFACGGGNEEEATLKSISVTGGTTEYYDVWANTDEAKHTAFSLGELVVTGKYDTEDEEKATQVLTSDQYEVDAADLKAAYESAKAGSTIYTVTVSADSGKKTVEATYTATISHQYEDGKCVNCGATNETITINDSMVFPDWGSTDATTYTTISGEGSVYGELLNERWVKYGTIDRGQVYTLSGTITPTASEGWDTPMFAIAANGEGLAVRTDNWIIHAGNAIGGYANLYSTPLSDGAASSGTADTSSEDWVVYYAGPIAVTDTTCGGKGGTADFIYTVSYDENSIITINYTTILDGEVSGNATYSMKVPANVYDVLFFGEECETTVTELSITKEFEMTKLENEGALEKTVYAENTYIDRTGINLIGTYSKGDPATITAYAIYGETADGVATLLTNGSTLVNPVTAEMTKFYISFGGKEIDLGTITVVPSSLKGATTSFDLTYNGVQFENGNASYDYDVNASGKIALIGSGTADRLTAEQQTALGTSNEYYYVAFHLYGEDSEKLAEEVKCSNTSAVVWYKDNGVNVILPVDSSVPASFTITVGSDVTEETVVNVDLSKVTVPDFSGVVVSNDSTLDKGGNVEVWYYGYTLSTIDNVTVYNITGAKYSELTADGGYTFKASGVKASAKFEDNILKVTYQLPALLTATVSNPNLSVEFRVYGAGGSATSPDVLTSLTYNLKVSETPADGWYKVSDTEYLVAAESAGTTTLSVVVLEDSRQLKGTVEDLLLNVQNEIGEAYDLSFSVESDGKDAAKAVFTFEKVNTLTTNAQTTIGIVGSINDDTDGDYGAVYMVKLNVTTALGLKLSDDNGFCVEVVDSARAANNKIYTILNFTSKGIKEITADVSTMTPVGIAGDCVYAATAYYVYESLDFAFANTTGTADGKHNWVDGVCSICGSKQISDEKNTGVTVQVDNATVRGVSVGFTLAAGVMEVDESGDEVWTYAGDWDSILCTSDNIAVCLVNLDCYWQTEAGGVAVNYPSTSNAYPNGGDATYTLYNGATWEWYKSKTEIYVTITVSPSTGITYYKNGVKVVNYPANGVLNDGSSIGNMIDYILKAVEDGTAVFNRAGDDVSNVTLYTAAIAESNVYMEYINASETELFGNTIQVHEASYYEVTDTTVVSWDWNGTTTLDIAENDFLLIWEYDNINDPTASRDVVVEFYNSSELYFDCNLNDEKGWGHVDYETEAGSVCNPWGGLKTNNVTYSYTIDGETVETLPTEGASDKNYYEGHYTVTILRVGTTLYIEWVIETTSGSVYTANLTMEGFTTEALTAKLSGSTDWCSNYTALYGTVTVAETVAEEE